MMEIRFRPATQADYPFLYSLHRQTFLAYVDQTWGWDEAQQEMAFRQEFAASVREIICWREQDIGSIVVEDHDDFLFLDYIAILPAYQNQGMGTAIVKRLLEEGARRALPVKLSVLKVNPARYLYERLGFCIVGNDEYRYYMEAKPENWPSGTTNTEAAEDA